MKKEVSTTTIIVAIVVVVALLAVAGWWFFSKQGKKASVQPSTEAEIQEWKDSGKKMIAPPRPPQSQGAPKGKAMKMKNRPQ